MSYDYIYEWPEIDSDVSESKEEEFEEVLRRNDWYFNLNTTCRWSRFIADLLEFSKKFPDIAFHVDRKPEEFFTGFERHYFKNGKSYFVEGEITYPAFDESCL